MVMGAYGLSGSMGKALFYGNSYHVLSRVVTSVSAYHVLSRVVTSVSSECVAMNVGVQLSSALTTKTAGYKETSYTASHSRAH